MAVSLFIPTAEAAFIAGLTDRKMSRVVDEHLVPEPLIERCGSKRAFTRLGAAFAQFYFATEDQLLPSARKQVLDELTARVVVLHSKNQVLALMQLDALSWKVERNFVTVDLLPFLQAVGHRAREVAQAHALVTEDPDVMADMPVFAGTRVPIGLVLASLAAGVELPRLKDSYPFLTEAHVQSAQVYEAVHPRRGRQSRLVQVNTELTLKGTRAARQAVRR